MKEDRNKEPAERMRSILSSADDDSNVQFKRTSKSGPEQEPEPAQKPDSQSLLDKLPRKKTDSQNPPQIEVARTTPKPEITASSASLDRLPRNDQPEQPLRDDRSVLSEETEIRETPDRARREKFLRALWTTASVFSMLLNIVVIILLVVALWAYRDIRVPEGLDMAMLNNILSGLHTNFEKLDRATIVTVIPVDAQIPLDITVPVRTTTQITLSETVNIPNAQVVINTGGLNINSTARVTLPAGTPLTVNLDFDLPVQTSIPVHLDVPVNIPMAATELHEPFVGLQEVVRPIYCFVDPDALNLDGQLICQ